MQNAIRDAFMAFLRESPLHLKASRSIGKAMEVARRAEFLEETPYHLRWTTNRELLAAYHLRRATNRELMAADITMLGLALVEGRLGEPGKGVSGLPAEYRRLLEGLDQTLWGNENCGEAS